MKKYLKYGLFQQKLIFLFLVVITVSILVFFNDSNIFYKYIYPRRVEVIFKEKPIKNDTMKLILTWNDKQFFFGNQSFFGLTEDGKLDRFNCKVNNCIVTSDRTLLDDADAVMIEIRVGDIPPYKYTHQRWIYVAEESPCNANLPTGVNYFNWTLTYKKESDIFSPYASYCKRKERIKIDYKKMMKSKKKLVGWMVSNCETHSEREDYVSELMKYVGVDVYGKCGKYYDRNFYCPKNEHEACIELLQREYKFYLGFENSLDNDYVTEKYFDNLSRDIVPIVRGGSNYSEHGPPESFIDTKDFKSPLELANYLKFLDNNDNEYIQYLKYKEDYKPSFDSSNCQQRESRLCQLCRKLNDPSEAYKSYPDMKQWFGECKTPNDFQRKSSFGRLLSKIYRAVF